MGRLSGAGDVTAGRTFRLRVAYDGTEFHGWQVQPERRTVQGELERAVRELLAGQEVRVHGAGRTDAGVHARGQGASFAADTRLPASALGPLLNRRLPADVRVTDAVDAPPGFHARHSARERHYAYRLLGADDVLWSRYAWSPQRRLPTLSALREACAPLVGTHDCSAFQSAGSSPVDPVCRIRRADWESWEFGMRFEVVADHFLYRMVRTLVGTALDAGETRDPARSMAEVLDSRDRTRAGVAAAAHGLCLEAVRYEEGMS